MKSSFYAMSMVLILSFSVETAFAQTAKTRMTGEDHLEMHKKGKSSHKMMHGMMMKSAMPQSMGVTEDGEVFVLAGNKILKYDSELNLVKEQQIPADFSGMQGMMQKMQEQCPMCQSMTSGEEEAAEEGHGMHHGKNAGGVS